MKKRNDDDPCLGCEQAGVPHGSDGGHKDVRQEDAERHIKAWGPPEHTDPYEGERVRSEEEVRRIHEAGL